ncbi:Hypothetical predicted protein [Pelobates cultripes]|uniref:Transmembrane protein 265 n=1 Tax=Pelobates cultripes TaxID=61616 RepID=A0AAD1WZ28_PELCU|nr:Hypothetical predicted protein [Pelobates cultripes]
MSDFTGGDRNGPSVEETTVFMPGCEPQTPTDTKLRSSSRSFFSCGPRHLAILSIVCGLSCVGIKALLLALKAEKENNKKLSKKLSCHSYRISALSLFLFWFGMLVCLPLLLILISYILAEVE